MDRTGRQRARRVGTGDNRGCDINISLGAEEIAYRPAGDATGGPDDPERFIRRAVVLDRDKYLSSLQLVGPLDSDLGEERLIDTGQVKDVIPDWVSLPA